MGPAGAAPNRPEPIEPFDLTFQCTDGPELNLAVSGKTKEIETGKGVKVISPGFRVTVTNTTTGESATYTATGTIRSQTLPNGDVAYKATGRNVIIVPDPDAEVFAGELFLTSGNVSFVNDAEGNEVERFSGPGRVTDICQELT